MNKKDTLNESVKLATTYEYLYMIYEMRKREIKDKFLENISYIEFFKNKRKYFEAFFDYLDRHPVGKADDAKLVTATKSLLEALSDPDMIDERVKHTPKIKNIEQLQYNMGSVPSPNVISDFCRDKKGEKELQKAQFIKLAINKYLAVTSCGKDNKIWIPICENNFLKVMEKIFKIDKECSRLFCLPFFSVVNSEVFASGILKAKFDDELFEDISLNAAKAYKIIVGGPLPAVNTPSATSSAMMYAAPSPVKLASPTMAFFTQNLTSNPITLIDFKEKIAIKIQDKTLHVMGLFSDKLIEFLKECKHILNKNKKDEILLVSPNAKEDEETTTQILTFYSVLFMLNPNFINDLFHPKM